MKKLCLCALVLLCGCDRPESVVNLTCGLWDVDAQIYKDKVVLDIVNTGALAEPNEQSSDSFVHMDGKKHIVADNYTVISESPETGTTEFTYYMPLTSTDGDEHGRIGVWIVRDNQANLLKVRSLDFGTPDGLVSYFCYQKTDQ